MATRLLLVFTMLLLVGILDAATKPTRLRFINNSGVSIRGRVVANNEFFLLHHGQSFTRQDSQKGHDDVTFELARACPGMGPDYTAWRPVIYLSASNPSVGSPHISWSKYESNPYKVEGGPNSFFLSENEEKVCDNFDFLGIAATCRRNGDSGSKEMVATLNKMAPGCRGGENCLSDWRYVVCFFM